jgi:hypothetical protein
MQRVKVDRRIEGRFIARQQANALPELSTSLAHELRSGCCG